MSTLLPKSILKRTPLTPQTKEERDRETALYHANLIQQRKNIEFRILESTEALLELPTKAFASAKPQLADNPSSSDVHFFKTALQPFQPSDYDVLIQERNINRQCGYTLCPNPNRTDDAKGGFRIMGAGRGPTNKFKVVSKEELERWCSEECARRALYVRVQLSERPAWERGGSMTEVSSIELLDEPKQAQVEDQLMQAMGSMDIDKWEQKQQGNAELAMERGDRGRAAIDGLVDVQIYENEVTRPATDPQPDSLEGRMDNMHLSLEGYTPTTSVAQGRYGTLLASDDEDDINDGESDQDMDWKI